MKTTSNTAQRSIASTQRLLTSKLGQIGLTLTAAFCGFALSTPSIAQAQTGAAIEHPGWVHVPGELIRPDCVHEIPNGAKIEVANGQITGDVTLNGALVAHYDACSEDAVITRPHQGDSGTSGITATTFAGGWVEAAQWNVSLSSSDNIDLMWGTWTVPPAPSENGGLIFLWNGLENSNSDWVLQPVLQYGENEQQFGGNYWVIASWLVGPKGYIFHSPPEKVNPGDDIFGYTEITGTSGSTLDWKVNAQDLATGAYSWITATSSGLHWTWAFGGVLEAYNTTSCSQFPSNGTAVFNDFGPYHGFPDYDTISPLGWYVKHYDWVEGPNCGFKVALDGETMTLSF